jgi:hypothetical protein
MPAVRTTKVFCASRVDPVLPKAKVTVDSKPRQRLTSEEKEEKETEKEIRKMKREAKKAWEETLKPWVENRSFRFPIGTLVRFYVTDAFLKSLINCHRPCIRVTVGAHFLTRLYTSSDFTPTF